MAGVLDILGGLISSPPTVPQAPHVSLSQQQQNALNNNLGSLSSNESLASGTNTFNQEQLTKMLQAAIPGYQNLIHSASGNIESMISGQVPKDVQDLLQSNAAGRALSGGYGGTGMARDLNARDLGLTSLDLVNKGISSAQSWIGTMKQVGTPAAFDVSSMFVTPGMQTQNAWQNQNSSFSRNWLNNQLQNAYAPNNIVGASLGSMDSLLGSTGSSILGSYAGGAVGGGGGGGGGGGM